MKTLHLICNAHLDPVWQWEWEEGAAAALSTFRMAATLCEEFDGFVFNHNEAILYQWIEEYEPTLFCKIQELVEKGKWHIMGGWYLQPDCNMPSGESFVRQILMGKQYFMEKFGVEPKTAVNFDPFGHTRGLVQILKKSGHDSYLFMRPDENEMHLPADDFLWVGFDGSTVPAHRLRGGYNSALGKAAEKVTGWLKEYGDKEVALLTWGVGNHGGGPSRKDIEDLNGLIAHSDGINIQHSTPEAYFQEIQAEGTPLPEVSTDLNPNAPGCYTSQVRIKQKHRTLENEFYMTEKMLSSAALQGLLEYPQPELREAMRDLLTSEFHDILPGSSVQTVEESSLKLMDHGLEAVSRLKARAFFALASGQESAGEGRFPILVYNPHPFRVSGIFECEFMLADQNWKEEFTLPVVYSGGKRLPSQPEKENSNMSLDWRKRVAFTATLEPSQMNRFDARLETLPRKPEPQLKAEGGKIKFSTDDLEVVINCSTGLVDEYKACGTSWLFPGAFQSIVIDDYDDSWGTTRTSWRDSCGAFRLMTPEEGAAFSGIRGRADLPAVRVIEDGEARTVVEALFTWGDSRICQRYKLPKRGTEVELETRVIWGEKSKMLKLSVPTVLADAGYLGQTAFGVNDLKCDGKEVVSQKWSATVSAKEGRAFTCIDDGIYGSDMKDGEIRLSLLRSPGYTCIDMSQFSLTRPMMPDDRFSPRMDQGERIYRFWFNGGPSTERLEAVDRESIAHNEKPYALSFFPSGEGIKPDALIELDGGFIQMSAFKKSEESEDYIMRLFNPTDRCDSTIVRISALGISKPVVFGAFDIKTFKLNIVRKSIIETDLMEREVDALL